MHFNAACWVTLKTWEISPKFSLDHFLLINIGVSWLPMISFLRSNLKILKDCNIQGFSFDAYRPLRFFSYDIIESLDESASGKKLAYENNNIILQRWTHHHQGPKFPKFYKLLMGHKIQIPLFFHHNCLSYSPSTNLSYLSKIQTPSMRGDIPM